jgi:hypothetical protein
VTIALIKTGADLSVLPAHPESCCLPAHGHAGMIHLGNRIVYRYKGKCFATVTEITKTNPLLPQTSHAGQHRNVPRALAHPPVQLH